MNMMILSVVVIHFNSLGELRSNFPGLKRAVQAEAPESEFIIVDNASSDGVASHVREHFPDAILHVEPRNIFFGPAANRGIALARGELVLLLNPDVAVENLDFHAVRALFAGDPRLFAVQPHVQDPRDGQVERLFSLAMRRGLVDVRAPQAIAAGEAPEIPFVTGGAAFFRRSIFLALGGFDPLFSPFYWEDVDLGVRAVRSGFVNRFLPAARFLHWHSTIIDRHHDERSVKSIYERNRLLFFYKHASRFSLPFFSHLLWLAPRLIHSLASERSLVSGFLACRGKRRELRISRRALASPRPSLSLSSVISRFGADGHE